MCLKKCNKCQELKEYSEFNKKEKSKDGYNPTCKFCISLRRKELKISAYSRVKTELHKIVLVENRELRLEGLTQCHTSTCRVQLPIGKTNHYCSDCQKAQTERDRKKVLAQKKAYRDKNKEKQKAYRDSIKESRKEYDLARYKRKKTK